MDTGTGAVERAIQMLKNLIIANLEDNTCLTECVKRALNVKRFTIHTGLKTTPFELHHGRKPRTELTNISKDGKSFLPNWRQIHVLANSRPKIPIYVTRNGDGEESKQNRKRKRKPKNHRRRKIRLVIILSNSSKRTTMKITRS